MTLSMPQREPWMDDAVCAQADPEVWFPVKGAHGTAKRAKAVCRGCPAVDACLQYALKNGCREGIWGGLSPKERQRLSDRRPGQQAGPRRGRAA